MVYCSIMNKHRRDITLVVLRAMVDMPECQIGGVGLSGANISLRIEMGLYQIGGLFGSVINGLLDALEPLGLMKCPPDGRRYLWTFAEDPAVVIGKVMVM